MVLACVIFAWLGAPIAQSRTAPDKRCGTVRGEGTTFRVDVIGGTVACSSARRVISYVLSHGPVTMGAPGSSPPGWSCGWGYGYYHGNHEQSGRAGPLCVSGRRTVQGTQAGYTPALS